MQRKKKKTTPAGRRVSDKELKKLEEELLGCGLYLIAVRDSCSQALERIERLSDWVREQRGK